MATDAKTAIAMSTMQVLVARVTDHPPIITAMLAAYALARRYEPELSAKDFVEQCLCHGAAESLNKIHKAQQLAARCANG